MVQMFCLKRYVPNVILLFLTLKEGTGFARGTICFLIYVQSFLLSKIGMSEGLKTTLKLKEVLITAKVSLVPFKVNASLITLL